MTYYGYEGYLENARKVTKATDFVVEEIAKMKELKMIGSPKLGNVAIRSASDKVNVLDIGTMMEQKGWF